MSQILVNGGGSYGGEGRGGGGRAGVSFDGGASGGANRGARQKQSKGSALVCPSTPSL